MSNQSRSTLILPAILAGLLAATLPGGCSDTSTSTEPEPDAVLNGSLDTTNLVEKAGQAALDDDVWVVAVSRAGDVDASCGLLQPLEGIMPFSLDVRTGHDYVVEFRHDYFTGPTLGVLTLGAGEDLRAAFTVPAGAGQVDLGVIVLDTASGLAASSTAQDLSQHLPAPAAAYPDRDGDQLPDAFDRDDDNDGIADEVDLIPAIVSYSLSGGQLNLETPAGPCEARLWMEGDFNGTTGRLTVTEAAPARFIFTTHLSFEVISPQFQVWVDSLPLILNGHGSILQGNLRIGTPGYVRVTVVPGSGSPDEPDLLIRHIDFDEVQAQTRLTAEEMRCLGQDPENLEPHLQMAWLGVEGVRALQEFASVSLRAFDYCFQNRFTIRDARVQQQTDLALPCFTFPGDGSCGQATFAWQDEDADEDVNPGDSFAVSFQTCWMDHGEAMVDEMLEGALNIHRYIDIRDHPDGVVMGAQYLAFDALWRQETEIDGGVHVIDEGSQITVSSQADDGGYGGPALWITF